MEKWLILRLEEEIYRTSLKHLVLPESKEVLKNKQANKQSPKWGMLRGDRSKEKQWPMAKPENKYKQQNK